MSNSIPPDHTSVTESSSSLGWVTVWNEKEHSKLLIRYDDFVRALFKKDTHDMMVVHAALGLASEAGEAADAVKKAVFYEQPIDLGNLIEEIGDIRFYLQALMNKYHISEQQVLQHNAEKLSKRYWKGEYSNEQAVGRADKQGEA